MLVGTVVFMFLALTVLYGTVRVYRRARKDKLIGALVQKSLHMDETDPQKVVVDTYIAMLLSDDMEKDEAALMEKARKEVGA